MAAIFQVKTLGFGIHMPRLVNSGVEIPPQNCLSRQSLPSCPPPPDVGEGVYLVQEGLPLYSFLFFFFSRLCFLSSLGFTAVLSRRYRDLPYTSPPHTHLQSLPYYHIPHRSGTFVTIDEPTLAHHCPSEFTLGLTLGGVHSVGLDKCLLTCILACILHYSIIQRRFTH